MIRQKRRYCHQKPKQSSKRLDNRYNQRPHKRIRRRNSQAILLRAFGCTEPASDATRRVLLFYLFQRYSSGTNKSVRIGNNNVDVDYTNPELSSKKGAKCRFHDLWASQYLRKREIQTRATKKSGTRASSEPLTSTAG